MVNKAILIGRLGNDALQKDVTGKNVTSFSLATSETYKDKKGEVVDVATWHNITHWGALDASLFKKGTLVCIEGKINNRSYLDKDGIKKYISEIIANKLNLVSANYTPSEPSNAAPRRTASDVVNERQQDSVKQPQHEGHDDLPF